MNASLLIPSLQNNTLWLRLATSQSSSQLVDQVLNGTSSVTSLFNQSETHQFNITIVNMTSIVTSLPAMFHRIEYYFLPLAVIIGVLYLLVFVFFLICSRTQLLRSRGLWPLIGSVLLMIHYGVGLIPSFMLNLSQIYASGCYIEFLGQHPFALCFVTFFGVHYLRYVTLFHLSIRKEFWYKSGEDRVIPFYFKLIKFLGTDFGQLLVLLITFSIQFGWFMIWIVSTSCNGRYLTIILLLAVIPPVILSIVAFIYDMILAIVYIQRNSLIGYIKNDVFLFRIEFLGAVFGVVTLVIVGQVLSFTRFPNDDPSFIQYFDVIILGLVNTVTYLGMYIWCCAFVTIMTMIGWCRPRVNKIEVLDSVLSDPELSEMFLNFAKAGMSNSLLIFRVLP
jgi:hypothetical protein